jgi:hypothetical protein
MWSGVHNALDIAGTIPIIGEIADGANAAIYFAEGDNINGTISVAAMIPFWGWTATGGKFVKKAADKVGDIAGQTTKQADDLVDAGKNTAKQTEDAAGQLHHPISKPVFGALKERSNFSQAFKDKYRVFTTRAETLLDHRGYQEWHRKIDTDLVNWLEKNPEATEKQFIEYLKELYSNPEIAKKFPGFLIDLENWLKTLR